MSRLFHLLPGDSRTLHRTRSIRDNIPQRTDITILRKKTKKGMLTTPGTRYRLGRCKWSDPTDKGAHWLHHVTSDHDKMMIISKMRMLVKILWQDNKLSRHFLHCYKYWTYTNMNPRLFRSPHIHQPCVVEAGRGLGVVGIVVVGLVTGQPSSSSPSLQSRVPSHFELLV